MFLGNASVSGQTGVGVFMHDHIAYYLLGLDSKGYQQNACFEASPKIIPLSSSFGLVNCLFLLLQTNNSIKLGDD